MNDSVHSFDTNCFSYEKKSQYFNGSSSGGTLLKTVITDYSYLAPPSWPGNGPNLQIVYVNVVPIRVTTQWPNSNGQQSKIESDYDPGFTMYAPKYYFPSGQRAGSSFVGFFGNVIAARNFDYGTGSPGPLLRQTKTTYQTLAGPNASSYLANNLLSLPYTVQVLDSSGTQVALAQYNYDETSRSASGLSSSQQLDSAPPTGNYRGNNTSLLRWLNSGMLTCPDGRSAGNNFNVTSTTTYFDTGTVQTSADPCRNITTSAYSLTYWAAYPTTVTNALNQPTNYGYDFNTGLLTSTTDPNGLTTSFGYDNMLRLSQVNHPDGAVDTITRQEASFPFTSTLNKQINTGQTKITTSVFDGLARVTQTQINSDPQGVVYADTTYDALGRVSTISNPHRTCGSDITSSCGITTYGYDAIGRKTSETYPDGSVLQTAYCGPSTLVTDPAGRWRRSRVNGLGHLVEVDEPNAVGATVASTGCSGTGEPIWVTSYGYDTLGNLTTVLQNGSHSRSFTYDSLSRLLCASNPENSSVACPAFGGALPTSGAVTYAYWPDGPTHTKTDARSITTSYLYDALHRQTWRSYSNGDPSVTTTYDQAACLGLSACQNIGHRTRMTDAAGSNSWAYQVDKTNFRNTPNIRKEQRITNSVTKPSTYYADFAGNIAQVIYPTGRVVNYSYDNADRPTTAVDGSNGITYATGFKTSPGGTCLNNLTCYTPQGTFYGLSIGQTSSFTGLNLTHTYNIKLQPQRFNASTGTTVNAAATATWTSQFLYKWTATIKIATPSPTNVSAGESITASGWTPSFINGSYVVWNVIDSTHFTVTLRDNTNHGYGTNASGSLTFVPNVMDISYSFSFPANSGHVYVISNNLDSTRTQWFTYDQLNRIASAFTSSYSASPTHCFNEAYNVDAWGNLQSIAATTDPNFTGCTQESGFSTTADGNNHLPIFSYDASGNTSSDGGVTNYQWDAESQLKSAAGVTYTYDGDGRRVSKVGSKLYWYGSGSEILAETDACGNTTAEYIFFGGKRIAMIPWSGANCSSTVTGNPIYYVEDLLGTSRVITSNTGVVCYDADFYPYGGERSYTNTCPQNYKFEGKERDSETLNDDFGARYYSNRFGRWLSADWSAVPAPVPYANLSNPQTLNLYAMVADDPESFADLDGHCLPCAIEEAANSPAGQWLLDNTLGLAIAAGAAIYAESKGWFNNAADFIQANPSVTGPDPAVDLYNATLNENTSDSKPGEVYVTEPQESGKPYVGRTTQGTDKRMANRTDGRKGKAETVDTYKTTEEGQYKEQKAMDDRGGKGKLDNKRREVNPQRMKELDEKYGPPKTPQPPVTPAPVPKPCPNSTSTTGTC